MPIRNLKPKRSPVQQKADILERIGYTRPAPLHTKALERRFNEHMHPSEPFSFYVGEHVRYIYEFRTDRIIRIGDGIRRILGIGPEEVIAMGNKRFFTEFLSVEHANSLLKFSTIFYEALLAGRDKDMMTLLEVNMQPRTGEHKRILFQVKTLCYDKSGRPAYTGGIITDITPLKKDGSPQLILMENGRFKSIHRGASEELLNPFSLPHLSKREIDVLTFRARGLQTKEIAEKLGLQRSTVFSYLRNIRGRTQMDTLQLIRILTEKGVIS
ncbi:MAG: Bacterial regulatory protein luxR family [Bacteroidota bacterium]|jgi:DNA-binding CsgD family transcriptional regulator